MARKILEVQCRSRVEGEYVWNDHVTDFREEPATGDVFIKLGTVRIKSGNIASVKYDGGGTELVKCEACGASFDTAANLGRHRYQVHEKRAVDR